MDEFFVPQLMLVAGAGRNSGKTRYIIKMIEKFSVTNDIIAIKLSPHLHQVSKDSLILSSNRFFTIVKETNKNTGKDSSLFLLAGAETVYYLQTADNHLKEAWLTLQNFLPQSKPMICEGGWLRKFVKPGLFVFCSFEDPSDEKESAIYYKELADIIIDKNAEPIIRKISFDEEKGWFSNPRL